MEDRRAISWSLVVVAALARLAAAEAPPANLSADQIATVMRSREPAFRACFNAALKKTPDLRGPFAYKLTIEPSGKVRRAAATRPTSASRIVDRCIVAAIEKIVFPASASSVTIVYPFNA